MKNVVILVGLGVMVIACEPVQQYLDERTFLSSCDAVLKERLKSPSTYKRMNSPTIKLVRREISDDEFEESLADDLEETKEWKRRRRADGNYQFKTKYETILEYDVANKFGTPIRDLAICESRENYGDSPSELAIRESSVQVDGYTRFEWTTQLLEEAIKQRNKTRRQ